MGKFSPDEIRKRTERLLAVRHLGTAATIRKSELRRKLKAQAKIDVKLCADHGIFIPVQDFE
jgi:hypothetical protein